METLDIECAIERAAVHINEDTNGEDMMKNTMTHANNLKEALRHGLYFIDIIIGNDALATFVSTCEKLLHDNYD